MPRPTAVPNHHPTRRWTYPCSETLQRSPITRTSPLLSLPNEILLIILHLVIASETPTTQLTTPHPNLKCTCVPLLPNPSVRSSTKKPWPSRLRTSLKKPWYSHCLRLCNRLESWAADPGLPHLYPPSRMPNLSVARTCQALYPLAVEALYALNTLTLTSSEVEVMLLSPAGKGVMEKLTGLRVLERKIEDSIWVQELIYRPPRTVREDLDGRARWPAAIERDRLEREKKCCGGVRVVNAEVLWILLNGKRMKSLTIDLEPFMMCPKRAGDGEWRQHVGSPMRCLEAFGMAWGSHVISEGIGRYSVEMKYVVSEQEQAAGVLEDEEQPGEVSKEEWIRRKRLEPPYIASRPNIPAWEWAQLPKGDYDTDGKWTMYPSALQALPLHKLALSHNFLIDTWKSVSTTPKPLLRTYADEWTPTYLRADDCPWYPKTPLCRITRDLLFAEMASVLNEVYQQYVNNGSVAARVVVSHFLTEILKIGGSGDLAGELVPNKVLPGEDARWDHLWTEAFALLVIGSRFRAEKVVRWKARK
ncbi:unnamed protein product [Zymoseptoria tritici ST99CH_1A5]|uniref:Uncharacterized protein n=3 Tax=Zymoseptoria tritici TaxID=1047171 RepID=A0A1X7RVP5_ZYMT9|nr:unnamed protein product [Zymoseptoria tritici ST99CH_3D7]SMR53572.1 unnamed protein product [Zymoseptoria tritici ST99CH_1E4]SMY25139.1 unnamed protein product [Zymoseptoria tritici ST99CH_1A5]